MYPVKVDPEDYYSHSDLQCIGPGLHISSRILNRNALVPQRELEPVKSARFLKRPDVIYLIQDTGFSEGNVKCNNNVYNYFHEIYKTTSQGIDIHVAFIGILL